MKFTELKNSIAQGAQSIYLLEGDDAYFRSRGEEMIKSAFLTLPELNFASFEGEALKGANLTALISAVESFPFMAEKRVIRVSEFYPSESDYESRLKNTFEHFPQTTVLIIVNSQSKKGAADLKRKRCVTYVDCNKSDEETVTKWVYITLKRAGISADVGLCTVVAQYCLCDMARVSSEVQKLIEYKGSGSLSREEVDALVYKDAEYRFYEMTNAVARKNYSLFCTIAYDLLQKGSDETAVMNSLFSYFRNLLTVLSSSESDAALAAKLRMKEYGVKKSREQAYALGEAQLKRLTAGIYGKISAVKRGEITAESAFKTCVAEIFFNRV